MADSKGEQLLDRLREYVQEQGERNSLTNGHQPQLHSFCMYFGTYHCYAMLIMSPATA